MFQIRTMFAITLAAQTLAVFAQEVAVIGVPHTVTIQIPPPENTQSCNIEITLPSGEKLERELSAPQFEGKFEFIPKQEGVSVILWEGKIRFRGLKTALGCPGSGKISIKATYPKNAQLNEQDVEKFQNARQLINEKRFSEAYRLIRPLAEKGDSRSQALLATGYYFGLGAERNFSEALKWANLAAEVEPAAMNVLGLMHFNGHGVRQDCSSAINYLRAAADKGHAGGMANIGFAHESGRCLTRDDREAVNLYSKAAELGNAFAMLRLGLAHERGFGVNKNLSLAVSWAKRAVEAGNEQAKNELERLARLEAIEAQSRQRIEADALVKKQEEERKQRWLASPEYKRQQAELAKKEQTERERVERERADRQRLAEERKLEAAERDKKEALERAERIKKEEADKSARKAASTENTAADNSKASGTLSKKEPETPASPVKQKVRSVLDL